jgi:hypothetical protein
MFPAENWPAYFACDEFNKTFFWNVTPDFERSPAVLVQDADPSESGRADPGADALIFFTAVSYAFL